MKTKTKMLRSITTGRARRFTKAVIQAPRLRARVIHRRRLAERRAFSPVIWPFFTDRNDWYLLG